MNRYDPELAPDPEAWLALDEATRISLARAFHASHGEYGESLSAHAAMHAVVETQVAASQPVEAAQALNRLIGAGLSRHDAIHALASVLAEFMAPILKNPHTAPPFDLAAYGGALSGLTASSWLGVGKHHKRRR
jgi:hypothetical protein